MSLRPAEPAPAAVRAAAEQAAPDVDAPAAGPRLGAGGELRLHGSVHFPAFGASLSFDWAFRRAAVGFGVDYAAWIDTGSLRVRPGALNLFALAMHRVPLGRVSLRQRVGVGPAIALAAEGTRRAGATGLFVEAAPLGLEMHTRVRRATVVLDAFSLAISAPVLGADLVVSYQYRLALGLRF